MLNAKVHRTLTQSDRWGASAVTVISASLVLVIAIALSACGKKSEAERNAGGVAGKTKGPGDSTVAYAAMDSLDPASAGSAAKVASTAGHAFDGFYIHRAYLEGLKASRSIFKTPFPNGSLYLQIQGDSVTLDYSNHEGGSGILRVDTGAGVLRKPGEGAMGNGFIAFRPLRGSMAQAWESGTDSSAEYLKLPKTIRTIEQLYGRLLLDGVYRCVGEGRCADTAILAGDSLTGLKGGTRKLRVAIDWLDNMPQMDFVVLTGSDTAQWAYTVSRDKLEFFAIDLPKACKSLEDYDCPLTDAKPGRKILELIRIGGAAAGSESRL